MTTSKGGKLGALLLWTVFSLAGLACPFATQAQKRLGGEFQVNTYTTGSQDDPAVAMNAAGDFVVVWESFGQDGQQGGIFGRRFASSGAQLGTEIAVNTYTTGAQDNPSVAMDADGDFVVAWSSFIQDNGTQGIFGQRFGSDGFPAGGEFQVNDFIPSAQFLPAVAANADGEFVVVWGSYGGFGDDDSISIQGQLFTSGGVATGNQFQVNSHTTQAQTSPSVARNAGGDFVVVWHSQIQDGSGAGVFGQRFGADGSPAGPELEINTYTSNSQGNPSVALDADGNFVVVWSSDAQDGDLTGVFGRRFTSGGGALGPEFQVNTYTTGNQYRPSVAMDAIGNFVVVWQSTGQDGSGEGIFGRRYTSDGAPAGGEFRVNTYTTNGQFTPSVAMDADGDFVVVWSSLGPDGDFFGIFGQRFRFHELDFFIGDQENGVASPQQVESAGKQD